MRVFILLNIFALATNVLANYLAGPYQMMMLWYAYRLEIRLYGNDPSQIQIASKCSERPAGCYLDEFLRYIQGGPAADRWEGSTTAGTDLYPDVEDMVDELRAQDYNSKQQNWYKLFPSGFTLNAAPKFSVGYTKIVNRIQTMRADAAARGVDISFELSNIRWSIIQTAAGRTADNAAWLISNLNKIIDDAGYSWTIATSPMKDMYGNTYSRADFAQTLADHANDGINNNQRPLSDDLKYRLATFITDFGSEDSKETESVDHYNAMQASRYYQDILESDKTCQIRLPKSWWGGA